MPSTIGSPGGSRGYAISNSPSRDTDEIAVPDSKDRDGPVLRFTAHEWGSLPRRRSRRGIRTPTAAASTPRRRRGFCPWVGFSDPDGNSWAVQELKVRATRPLIPPEARGRFGA